MRERGGRAVVAGAVASVAVGLAFFTRFSLDGTLSRDESIYAYAGQQLADGEPPAVSIFDPKGPGASTFAALGVVLGRWLGLTELSAVRLVFLATSLACVVLVYLLATRLWGSVLAGFAAAVVFAGFQGFAADAIAGPDAKTPGVMFLVAALLAALHGRWFWAGLLASCATLVWQPFVLVVAALLVAATVAVRPPARRWWVSPSLLVAGAAVPGVVTLAAYVSWRAVPALYEAALLYPLTGTPHSTGLGGRLSTITRVVDDAYGWHGSLLVPLGLAALPVATWLVARSRAARSRDALRDPAVAAILLAMLTQVAYACVDFQGYPDLYPVLPFAALGVSGAGTLLVRRLPTGARPWAVGGAVTAMFALVPLTWVSLTSAASADRGVAVQRTSSCALLTLAGPRPLYSLGSPVPFVLGERRSPDRFVYLGAKVDEWRADHGPTSFESWIAGIVDRRPSVVALEGWPRTPLRAAAIRELRGYGYQKRHVAHVDVFVDRPGLRRAREAGLRLTRTPTQSVLSSGPDPLWTCPSD